MTRKERETIKQLISRLADAENFLATGRVQQGKHAVERAHCLCKDLCVEKISTQKGTTKSGVNA